MVKKGSAKVSGDDSFRLKTPIILALDVDDAKKGIELCKNLSFGLGAIKIGPRLILQHGSQIIREASQISPVFVDNKYFDIPNTMESAVRQTFEAGATLATIHALSGAPAMQRLAKLEHELNQRRPFKVLCVTILTSFSNETLPPSLKSDHIDGHVKSLAKLAIDSGLYGLVCSPHEAEALRKSHPSSYLVTPGVRSAGTEQAVKGDDQNRVMTASQALKAGASALVIGRPIVEAKNPRTSLEQILSEI